jgi:hypothetical protein
MPSSQGAAVLEGVRWRIENFNYMMRVLIDAV